MGEAQGVGGHDEQGLADPPPARAAHGLRDARRGKRGEARVPPAVAVLVAVALYAALPESLVIGPRFLIPAVEVVLLVALIATNPWRLTRQTRWSRWASLLTALVVVTNLVTLGLLVGELVSAQDTQGRALLVAALQVWATNVIAFGLIYWELDRGGPVARTQVHPREQLPLADFRFTQDETQDTVVEVAAGSSEKADWIPTFVDYLYLVHHEFQCVQPDRHDAVDQPGEDPDGGAGHRRVDHLASGDRPRGGRSRLGMRRPRRLVGL